MLLVYPSGRPALVGSGSEAVVGAHFAVQRRASRERASTGPRTCARTATRTRRRVGSASAQWRGRCEKRRFRLLQDAADALRWERPREGRRRAPSDQGCDRRAVASARLRARAGPPPARRTRRGRRGHPRAPPRVGLRDGHEVPRVRRGPLMATRRPSPRRRARVLHHHVDRPGGRLARVSRRLARRVDSADLTVALFAVNKILQATAFFGFWHVAANDPDAIRTDDGDVRPRALSRIALGLPLVLAGQVLNAATYAAIGRDRAPTTMPVRRPASAAHRVPIHGRQPPAIRGRHHDGLGHMRAPRQSHGGTARVVRSAARSPRITSTCPSSTANVAPMC